ncbi:MAG: protocatechuate 3,4-dioxygenase [Alphaproteobacteria bacterium]|nr:protocatechuate 3,4-dioxygenase [Alphaproteobacteria bacterium]
MDSMPRRRFLAAATGAAIAGLVPRAQADEVLSPTPQITLGPFYPVVHPRDVDTDLTRLRGRRGRAEGEVIEVAGRVLNVRGEPAVRAELDVWQANARGRYTHPGDPNVAALDDNFQGFARLRTDRDGAFRLLTIKPGAYPADRSGGRWRPPHLHWLVTGQNDRITTQMMFPDEPYNATDTVLGRVPADRQADVIARALDPRADGVPRFAFDIILLTG